MTEPSTITFRSPSPEETARILARARQLRAEALADIATRLWAAVRRAARPALRGATPRTN